MGWPGPELPERRCKRAHWKQCRSTETATAAWAPRPHDSRSAGFRRCAAASDTLARNSQRQQYMLNFHLYNNVVLERARNVTLAWGMQS
jgi:hypothetical protein